MKRHTHLIMLLLLIGYLSSAQQLAFPTAEGHGKYTVGGRGGKVVEVINLNDSGTGSLRYALENVSGPKTIVFRVGGIIDLKSQLSLKNQSYVTIAGQTAPGGGICIKNFPLMIENCEDIIVRYLRSRLGDLGTGEDDAMSVRNSINVILDHCSLSWSIDSILDITHNSGQVTVQYCLLSEALVNSRHQKGSHGYAAGWDGVGGSSYHHNLIAHCVSRTPRLDKYLNEDGSRDLIEVINNVIYNWTSYGAYGAEEGDVNWINNYYRYGPETQSDRKDWIFGAGANVKMHVTGNYMYGFPDVTEDNSLGINYDGKNLAQIRADVLVDEPFNTIGIETETALEAYKNVLANVGAVLPVRDAVDERIVQDVIDGTGGFIDSQDEVGGWPTYVSGVAPDDSDHDGMPDDWEDEHSLDKNNAEDGKTDNDADGYTNLEEYLNELVVFEDPDIIDLPPVPVSTITVTTENDADTVVVGATVQCHAETFPEEANNEVTWSVNGDDVISIDPVSGILIALAPGRAFVIASATDGSSTTGSKQIVIETPLRMSATAEIKVFPNPANQTIKIESFDKLEKIELLNLYGMVLSTYSHHHLDISDFNSGTYFLRVYSAGDKRHELIRFVKL